MELHKLYSLSKQKANRRGLSQLTVASAFQPQPSSTKAQEMTKKIVAFIAHHGLQLYSVVEEASVIALMGRSTLSDSGVPRSFAKEIFANGHSKLVRDQKK